MTATKELARDLEFAVSLIERHGLTRHAAERLQRVASIAIARLRAAEAERDEAQGALVEMVHAAHGFAEAVRHHAGKAYPWPALDIAKDRARPIVLSRIQKEASDEV